MLASGENCCFLQQTPCRHSGSYVSIKYQFKTILSSGSAAAFIIITSPYTVTFCYRKNSQNFGEQYKKGIPIEVVPMAYVPVQRKITSMYKGCAKLRMAVAKAVSAYLYYTDYHRFKYRKFMLTITLIISSTGSSRNG